MKPEEKKSLVHGFVSYLILEKGTKHKINNNIKQIASILSNTTLLFLAVCLHICLLFAYAF